MTEKSKSAKPRAKTTNSDDSKSNDNGFVRGKIKVDVPSLEDMLKAGVHFGHRSSRWNPKMKPYIFGMRNTVHIIDLEQTQSMLADAVKFVQEITSKGGVILFVSSKKQAKAIVKEAAIKAGMPYINTPPGLCRAS